MHVFAAKKQHSSSVVLLVGAVVVVVPAAARLVEDLEAHVPVAIVGEQEDEAGFESVVARELLLADVELHLAAPVVYHVDDPPVEAGRSLPQMQRARSIVAGDIDGEGVRKSLDAAWVALEYEDELEQHGPLHVHLRR